jgi:hypothetical protein
MCNHKSCGSKEKVWLPYNYKGLVCGLKPHLFCTECGLVRIESSDKPKRLGYYINVIAALSKEMKITKVQMRLISMDLQKLCIDDVYSMDKSMQEQLFIKTVMQYVNVKEQSLRRYFEAD